jgi:hypothetical protein
MGAKRFITSAGKGVSLPFRQIGVAANLALREPPQFAGRAQERGTSSGPPGSNRWHSASPIGVASCRLRRNIGS